MSKHSIKVISRKMWKNSKTGRTASLRGAVPFTDSQSQRDWSVEQFGYTVQVNRDGLTTTGLCYLPFNASKEEALSHALEYAHLNSGCAVEM
jgi:hypothetical protein